MADTKQWLKLNPFCQIRVLVVALYHVIRCKLTLVPRLTQNLKIYVGVREINKRRLSSHGKNSKKRLVYLLAK